LATPRASISSRTAPDDVNLRDDGVELDAGIRLYLDIDKDAGKSSSNGILCRATVTRHETVLAQRYSTIGGVIYINDQCYGITTAHSMFDHVWDEANKGFSFDSCRTTAAWLGAQARRRPAEPGLAGAQGPWIMCSPHTQGASICI